MSFGTSTPRPRRSGFIIIAATLLASVATAGPAWAWGRVGHRVIARLAETRLKPETRAAIAGLLEPGESLADASLWADVHRRDRPKTAPWHYVDVPLDEPRYHSLFSGDLPQRGYVVDKIHDFRVILKDRTRPVADRRNALRFLIHFIEDLHMPLHVGDNSDKGGNETQIRFFDQGTNMHSLWDSGMIEHINATEDFWLADLAALDTPQARESALKGTIEDWATESLLAARQAYRVPETGKRLKPGQKLSDSYVKANLPALRGQLYKASVRLARVLNEALAVG